MTASFDVVFPPQYEALADRLEQIVDVCRQTYEPGIPSGLIIIKQLVQITRQANSAAPH